MKKLFVFITALVMAQGALAGKHVIVIKSGGANPKGNTEVKVNDKEDGNTITIKPGQQSTDITVSVKGLDGTLISQESIPATQDGTFIVDTPDYDNGIS